MKLLHLLHLLVFAVLLAPGTDAQPAVIPPLEEGERVTLASGLEAIWALDVLPDGRIIFTERPGRVQLLDGDGVHQIASITVSTGGERGLFGIVAHPDYVLNKAVYVMYTHSTGNRISMFTLVENPPRLIDEQIIADRMPSSFLHDGGRLKIGPDGKLYATLGDARVPSDAQDINSLAGKILRFELDGSIPNDNPFDNAVWSYGHRNPQGITWSPDGTAYSSEHGDRQLDEVNLIIRGGNYGWPAECGSGGNHIDPIWCTVGWTMAPGGIAYLDSALYVVGLRGAQLRRLVLSSDGQSIESEEQLIDDLGRLREVYAHNGILLITTSNRDGRGSPQPDDDILIAYRPTGVSVNGAPSFTSAPVTGATEDGLYSYAVEATDPDGDKLTFSEASPLSAWLMLTDNGDGTATLSGTPANGDVGQHNVDLQVSDGVLTDTQSFTITVNNVNDPPSAPEIIEPADGSSILIEGEPQDLITVQWTASLDVDGDTLVYAWQLSLTAAFEPLLAEVSSEDTTIALSVGAIASALTQAGVALNETVAAYHRVLAYDGELSTPSAPAEVSVTRGAVTSNEGTEAPLSTTLHQNYPNPFSSATTISYTLPAVADVTITVMDLLGRTVRQLVLRTQPAGEYGVLFDATGLPSGAYIYRLEAGDYVETKRMVVVK